MYIIIVNAILVQQYHMSQMCCFFFGYNSSNILQAKKSNLRFIWNSSARKRFHTHKKYVENKWKLIHVRMLIRIIICRCENYLFYRSFVIFIMPLRLHKVIAARDDESTKTQGHSNNWIECNRRVKFLNDKETFAQAFRFESKG